MSLLGAFVGGVAKTRLADMQAADEDNRDLDRFKKQQKILEDMRKSAEDAKVAAKRIVQGGNADEGPQQLMVEEYNPSGRVIGTRAASKGEEDEYVQGKQTRAANLAAAQSEAKMKADKETRAKEKHESDLKVNKAREASSYASAESSRAYAKNLANPTSKGPDTFRDESDFAYLVSAKQGGEALDAEYKQQVAAAMSDARALNADDSKLKAVMQELTREYILRAKRLPNKVQE